jgi:hypothetical protein
MDNPETLATLCQDTTRTPEKRKQKTKIKQNKTKQKTHTKTLNTHTYTNITQKTKKLKMLNNTSPPKRCPQGLFLDLGFR